MKDTVFSLTIDLNNTQTIYSGTYNGVYKSVDGGENLVHTVLKYIQVVSIVVDPKNSLTIYAGAYGAGVFKSTDGGNNWSEINIGLTNKWIQVLQLKRKILKFFMR